MKSLNRILSALLALLCAGVLILPAAATAEEPESSGVDVSVVMDKELYEDDEPITATITIKNTQLNVVTVKSLEQLIPEGYRLSPSSQDSLQDIELAYNETATLKVTFEKIDPTGSQAQSEDVFDKILNGKFWGIPNVLLILVAVIAFAVFMFLT